MDTREIAKQLIVAYILLEDTPNPAHPGPLIDYLPVADFEVVFTSVTEGDIKGSITVNPMTGLGSA
jgi:hypothetical protein